jgi:AcrR family transcriptional regulator
MNAMSTERRPYRLNARALRQEETRRRIIEATAALHAEVGPARTTVADIARRAGVQRLTVYTHFPDELRLISACQEHFYTQTPPPDLSDTLALPDATARLRGALLKMYGWYRASEAGFVPVLQDRGTVPALDQVLARVVDTPLAELATGLAAGFDLPPPHAEPMRAFIRLALDFWSWRRLKDEGLDDNEAAELMTRIHFAEQRPS